MGYGDFKLLAALGAWFGWQALPVLVLISSVVGIALGGTLMLIRRNRDPIPFGPYPRDRRGGSRCSRMIG